MDTLTNIESLKFTDMTVNLTVQARAAAAPLADVNHLTELYVAFFNRVPDADGLAYWNGQLVNGHSTRSSLGLDIVYAAHTFKGDPTWGWVADLLDNKIAVTKTFAIDWGLNYNTADDNITHGMAIAAAVTSTSTDAAIALIGVSGSEINLG